MFNVKQISAVRKPFPSSSCQQQRALKIRKIHHQDIFKVMLFKVSKLKSRKSSSVVSLLSHFFRISPNVLVVMN